MTSQLLSCNVSGKLLTLPTLILILLLSSWGCGSGHATPDHLPPLTPLTVTVNYQGNPVEGATILMSPDTGKYAAAGTTDASGKAIMKTDGEYPGVVAGAFKLTVAKKEKIQIDIGTTPEDPAEYAAYQQKLKSLPKPKHLLPEKYASFATSNLQLSVTEGTPANEVLELND